MASGGAVRELITKVKFQLDNASINKASKAIANLKKKLSKISNKNAKIKVSANTSAATRALQSVKSQLNAINGKSVTTYVNVKQRGSVKPPTSSSTNSGSHSSSGKTKSKNNLEENSGTVAAAGAAVMLPMVASIKKYMNVESNMSEFQAVTGVTREMRKELEKAARAQAAVSSKNAEQVTASYVQLARAGINPQAVSKVSDTMIKAAEADRKDVDAMTNAVIGAMSASGQKVENDAQRKAFMDAAAYTSNKFNTDMMQVMNAWSEAGGVMAKYGGTDQRATIAGDVALGFMANDDIKSSEAGNQLKNIIMNLYSTGGQASKAMEELGVSLKDGQGQMKKWYQVLPDVFKKLGSKSELERNQLLDQIGGSENAKGLMAMYKAYQGGGWDKKQAELGGGAANGLLDNMAKLMQDNLEGDMNSFKSALDEVGHSIAEGLIPALRILAQEITPLLQKFANFAKENPRLVAGITAFVTAAGVLLAVLGGIGLAISAVSTVIGALAPIFTAVGGVLSGALAPVIAIILAIAAAIKFVYENWDTVVEWFQPGIDSMKEGLAQLASAWENIKPLIEILLPLLEKIATLVGAVIVKYVSILWRVWSWVFSQMAGIVNWVTEKLKGMASVIEWVAKGIGGLINKALEFIGMKGEISGVNTAITQGWAEKAMAGGRTSNTNISVGSINVPTASDVGAGIGSLYETPTFFPA